VTVLTDSNFDSLVGNADTDQWFIEVYAPWCGACKKMQPVWERAATKLPPTTRVGAIDVTTNPMLEKRFTPEHYPTLMFFRAGYVYLYTGERTVKGFRAFAKEGYTSAPSARIPKAGDHAAVPQKSMVDATWVHVVLFDAFKLSSS
jgi:protein disulfide-isomerase A6